MKLRHFACAPLLIFFTFLIFSCKQSPTYKIGVSQCSSDDWREKMNEEIERELMFHEEATLEIRSANDNSEKQIEDIRYFAENGFDIIVVAPNEATSLTPVIKEVYESGIPVIVFDRNILGEYYSAHIGPDDVALGASAANYAINNLPTNPTAIEIYGLPGSTPADGRHKGFYETFTSKGGKILASAPANWIQEEAYKVTDSLLNIYNNVDLIYAHNDRMAIGASEIAKQRGFKNIKIIGIDAAPNIGIQAVVDSVIDATFLYPTEGERIVNLALAILKGDPYQKNIVLPVSSAVDRSNADILLFQNEIINEETSKMKQLKSDIDRYWREHSSQTKLFYASIAIIILLLALIFLGLRTFWQHQRIQKILREKNKMLANERDIQKSLNKKLEEATHSKLLFFTNVSHDLRTPLTLISEPVSQLVNASNLTPAQNSLVKIADRNIAILRRLINQILDFRKYESGKLELNLVETSLSQFIEECLKSFHSLAKKREIALKFECDENLKDFHAAIDPEKIERIIYNILSNAFKFTANRGEIHVMLSVQAENIIISISDTGIGISKEDINKIFDQFYQVEKIDPNGSGIGLALSKAFVELHGGTISVKSEKGVGSTFTIELPVKHVSEEAGISIPSRLEIDFTSGSDEPLKEDEYDSEKPLILVIDDNEDIRTMLETLLGETFNVISASTGSEGLKRAVRYVPSLIISDVMMPGMDGFELCKNLKNEIATSHIPVILLTACSLDEQKIEGLECGADAYLAKPFNSEVLIATSKNLIENRARLFKNTHPASAGKDASTAVKKKNAVSTSEIDNDFYQRFLGIIDKEISNVDLSVDLIASEIGLERSQLYRKIKALTGFSPVELIRKIRLRKSRALLGSSDMSISEIAYNNGFSSPAYFTKCYRDEYGETPSETREKLLGTK